MQYKDTRGAKDHALRCFKIARACLKNHFRNLQASLCGIFYRRSVAVARYAALLRIKDYKEKRSIGTRTNKESNKKQYWRQKP